MFVWMVPWSLMGLAMPSLNALMSRRVRPNEQGELQGALASLGSLTSITAIPSMSYLFAAFASAHAPVYFPGAAFLTAGFCLFAAAMFFAYVRTLRAFSPAQ
jgi:DHA1 family tetracycline resistance protein-like MFS transporter